MKMTSLLRLVALVQICLGASAYANGTESYVEAEKYIIECSRDWAEAVVTGDMSRRKIYFADDFMGTDTKGRRYDKASITRETGPAKSVISNRLESVQVRFFGDTAIAYGSEVWAKKDGSSWSMGMDGYLGATQRIVADSCGSRRCSASSR